MSLECVPMPKQPWNRRCFWRLNYKIISPTLVRDGYQRKNVKRVLVLWISDGSFMNPQQNLHCHVTAVEFVLRTTRLNLERRCKPAIKQFYLIIVDKHHVRNDLPICMCEWKLSDNRKFTLSLSLSYRVLTCYCRWIWRFSW